MEHWKQLELHKSSSAFSLLRGRKAVGESECRDANFQLRVCVHALSKCVHYKKKRKKRAAWRCCDTVPMFVSAGLRVCCVPHSVCVYVQYLARMLSGADGNLH